MHKLSSGLVIKHSHPFDNKSTGEPFQKHNHTSAEFIFLDQLSNTVFWIYLYILFLIYLLFGHEIKTRSHVIIFGNPDLYFLKNYHAPPTQAY